LSGRGNDAGEVRVETPLENAEVSSPLFVRGEANGNWFFEANIPIKIMDGEGKVIAVVGAQAESDWMTENKVPFSGELVFGMPHTATGTLVISKDNPSGLPENDASYEVPIRFTQSSTSFVSVYFGRYGESSTTDECNKVYVSERIVPKTQEIGKAAITELLKGPNEAEKSIGLFTSVPEGVALQSLNIENGIAKADFNGALNAGGSCRVSMIRAQIENTLKQFASVSSVIVSVDGNSEEALQP